jgi:hypothetical protein
MLKRLRLKNILVAALYSLKEKFPDQMRVIDEWKNAPSAGCNYATATSPIMAARQIFQSGH